MKPLPRTPSDLPGPEPTRLRGPVSHLTGGVRIAFSRPRILVFLLLVGMACALPAALAAATLSAFKLSPNARLAVALCFDAVVPAPPKKDPKARIHASQGPFSFFGATALQGENP